jgi:hypothetical protein
MARYADKILDTVNLKLNLIKNISQTKLLNTIKSINPFSDKYKLELNTNDFDSQWFNYLESIPYGFYDDTTKKLILTDNSLMYDVSYIIEHCHVLSPNEVTKYKVATCREFSIITYLEFLKYCKNVLIAFLIWRNPILLLANQGDISHHYIPIYQKTNNEWFYLEHAWGNNNGIFGPFNSTQEAVDYCNKKHLKQNITQAKSFTKLNFPVKEFLKIKNCSINQFVMLSMTESEINDFVS